MAKAVTKMAASARQEAAKAFFNTGPWRRLRSRAGASASDDGSEAPPGVVVLYKDGCPPNAFRDVHQYLAALGSVTDLMVDGEALPGTWHHVTSVWEKLHKDNPGVWSVVWTLSSGPVSETDVVEDGCGNSTTYRFEFDRNVVETWSEIAHAGSQGYEVKIGGVSRDKETNLVSYYVATTHRKTIYTGEGSGAPSAGFRRGEDAYGYDYGATWEGLYGTADSPTDEAGDGVSVWDPAVAAIGELRSAEWHRNSNDCTLNATGRRQVAKTSVEAVRSEARDLFGTETSVEVSAAPAALSSPPAPALGVTKRRSSKLRPDRLYDTSDHTKAEAAVSNAEVASDATVFESSRSVTDRSQATDPLPASAAGGTLRGVRQSRTPGDLKDNVVVTKTERPYAAAVVDTAADVFGEEVSTADRNQAAAPLAVTPGGGVSGSTSKRVTPGGLNDNVRRVKTETHVAGARASESRTLFQRRQTVSAKSSPGRKEAATAAAGVGTAASEAMTPGGRMDIDAETVTELFVGAATESEIRTVFERALTSTDVHSQSLRAAASASGGILVETSKETQPYGSRNLRTVTRQELPYAAAAVDIATDVFGREVSTADRNQAAGPSDVVPGGGVSGSTSKRVTPGGLNDNVRRVKTETAVPNARTAEQKTVFSRRRTHTDKSASGQKPTATAAAGTGVSGSDNMTPGGLRDIETVTDEELSYPAAREQEQETIFEHRLSQTDIHSQSARALVSAAGGVRVESSHEVQPLGSKNLTQTTVTEKPVASAEDDTDKTVFDTTRTLVNRNQFGFPEVAMAAGGVIRNTKVRQTPGGLRDHVVVTKTDTPYANAAQDVASDVFKTETVQTDRSQAGSPAAVTPGNGVSGATSRRTTPSGLNDNVRRVTQENSVLRARTAKTKTVFMSRETWQDRSSAGEKPEATAAAGLGVSGSDSMTPGGRKDVDHESVEEIAYPQAQERESVTLYERELSRTDIHSQGSRATAQAANGIMVGSSHEVQPYGTKNLNTVTRTELPVSAAEVSESGDKFSRLVRTRHANQVQPGALASVNPTPGTLKTRERVRTPGDKVTYVDTERTFVPVSDAVGADSGDVSMTRSSRSHVNLNALPARQLGFIGPGQPILSREWKQTAANQYDETVHTDTPGAFYSIWFWTWAQSKTGAPVQIQHVRFWNATSALVNTLLAAYVTAFRIEGSESVRPNRFMLFDGELSFWPWIGGSTGDDSYRAYNETNKLYYLYDNVKLNGVNYIRKQTITYDARRDWGLSGGLTAYAGGLSGPSSFRTLTGDWYEYVRVSSIQTEFIELTSALISSGFIVSAGGVSAVSP